MKTLKITLAVVAVSLLTFSGVTSENVVNNVDEPTYKEYSPKDLLATDKTKLKLETQA